MARIILAAAVLTTMAALVSCGRTQVEASVTPADSTPVVPVVKAARTNLTGELMLTAEFEPFQEVDVMAKVAGYVQSIKVDIGDHVKDGQVLATLEIPEMEDELAKAAATIQQTDAEVATAQDEIRRAQSAHEMAHLSYTRIQDVAKREKGLVPQQQVDEFRSHDLIAEAQVASANSNLLTAQRRTGVAKAEEARLRTLRKYAIITAPFDGVVTKRYANTGSMIQAGIASQSQAMPVVRISQNNLLRLILPVPESAVSRVRTGETVEVKVPSMSGKTFPGRVARLSDKVQSATRTMDVEVDVQNPGLTLVPGMYAEVNLHIEQRDNVVAVPLDALEGSGAATHVYAVTQSGVIRVANVKLGLETARKVEILSGLEDGDLVVVGRKAGLKDGDKVQSKMADFLADGTVK